MDGSGSMAKTYRGILLLVIALVPLSYFGFRASYWTHFPRFFGVGWEVHFHLLTIACWLAMLVAQAWLAVKGRIAQHKRIGRLSYVLVPLIVIGFVLCVAVAYLSYVYFESPFLRLKNRFSV